MWVPSFLIDEETEAQRGVVSFPRSHNEKISDRAFVPRWPDSRAHHNHYPRGKCGSELSWSDSLAGCAPPQCTSLKAIISKSGLGVLLLAKSSSDFSFQEELACFRDFPTPLLFFCYILHFSSLRASWEPEELQVIFDWTNTFFE